MTVPFIAPPTSLIIFTFNIRSYLTSTVETAVSSSQRCETNGKTELHEQWHSVQCVVTFLSSSTNFSLIIVPLRTLSLDTWSLLQSALILLFLISCPSCLHSVSGFKPCLWWRWMGLLFHLLVEFCRNIKDSHAHNTELKNCLRKKKKTNKK